jgi:hypothetical protein
MKPLTLIYWTRAILGLVIGILCGIYVYSMATVELTNFYTLLTGLSFAILFYIATYYIVKLKYFARVEKPSKLMTQGIGIYFFAWLVSWTLLTTLMMPTVSINIVNDSTGNLYENEKFWIVARNRNYEVVQNVTTEIGHLRMSLFLPESYTFEVNWSNTSLTCECTNVSLTLNWLGSQYIQFNITQFS